MSDVAEAEAARATAPAGTRLLVINPNSTAAMTDSIACAAQTAARPGTTITAVNPPDSPPAIQGPEDAAKAIPGMLALYATMSPNHDATIIACFDDPGVWTLKARASKPVLGIGEAACLTALIKGQRFAIVTTLDVAVPVIKANLHRYGFVDRCRGVRAAGIPVLDFETDPEPAAQKLSEAVASCLAKDKPDAIILGCAGMADLADSFTRRFGIPVIDGVSAAVGLAEGVVRR